MTNRNEACSCGSGKKWKKCCFPKEGPHSYKERTQQRLKEEYYRKYQIILKEEKQIEGIRAAGHLAAKILNETYKLAKAGVTLLELNDFAHRLHREAGAIPAPLNYGHPPFPKSVCLSLNEVICHGIPDKRELREGDILNIDVTCLLHGFYGDCSRMATIGQISPDSQLVVDVSLECLHRAVALLKPGRFVSDIGEAIESYAHAQGCSVVDQFVGHGVGVKFHENPQIPHGRNKCRIPLVPGMTFTIEPMINRGVKTAVVDPCDHWTARTADGKPSAQWEHTLLITQEGYEILTPWHKEGKD